MGKWLLLGQERLKKQDTDKRDQNLMMEKLQNLPVTNFYLPYP